MQSSTNFTLEDQLLMGKANNYKCWLYTILSPYLTGSVLEVGSGIGNLSSQIIQCAAQVNLLTCIEIDSACFEHIKTRLIDCPCRPKLNLIHDDFLSHKFSEKFDVIICLNVLEHIKSDTVALQKIADLLAPEGYLLCFVPAGPMLYGSIDRNLQHFRRYSSSDLKTKMQNAGLKIVDLRYYNLVGFFGWFLNNRLFKKQRQAANQVLFFDKYILPFQAWLETYLRFPFGQSLFCVAKKETY